MQARRSLYAPCMSDAAYVNAWKMPIKQARLVRCGKHFDYRKERAECLQGCRPLVQLREGCFHYRSRWTDQRQKWCSCNETLQSVSLTMYHRVCSMDRLLCH